MAGCIEDLFTQHLRDFDRLKSLNCSSMEERFQDFAHGSPPMLSLQHRNVANATCKRNAGARLGLCRWTPKTIRGHKSAGGKCDAVGCAQIGANQGVGFQVAKELVANGLTVLVRSRNFERGKAAAKEIGHGAV